MLTKSDKNPKGDELTIENAIVFLEECALKQMEAKEAAVVVKAEADADNGMSADLTAIGNMIATPTVDVRPCDVGTHTSQIKRAGRTQLLLPESL